MLPALLGMAQAQPQGFQSLCEARSVVLRRAALFCSAPPAAGHAARVTTRLTQSLCHSGMARAARKDAIAELCRTLSHSVSKQTDLLSNREFLNYGQYAQAVSVSEEDNFLRSLQFSPEKATLATGSCT